MNKRRNSSKNARQVIPEEFDLDKYHFKDDFTLWMSALARRVALRQEVDDILNWRKSEEALTEQRSALYSAWQVHIQGKVLALIDEPIPINSNDDFQCIPGSLKLAERERYLQQNEPISDRLVLDEIRSATKLQDQSYRNVFDKESAKLAKKRTGQPLSGLLGIPLRYEHDRYPDIDATGRFIQSYKMWQADMQMPGFSGEFGLKVNLLHDDEVLCRAFSEWLKKTRRSADFPMAKHKVVTANKLQDWHRMRILPYIDLWLFQGAFDASFTWKKIGELLYSGESESDSGMDYEKRAKDAHERAMNLTQVSVFFSLRYQESSNLSV